MRFDKDVPKRSRKRDDKLVQEVPDETIEKAVDEALGEETEVDSVHDVPPVVEDMKSREAYETGEGTAVLQYDEVESKKGYTAPAKKEGFCQLRERSKAVYGIKYAAGKGVDIIKKARTAIMDWCLILHKKGPQRKDEEELV